MSQGYRGIVINSPIRDYLETSAGNWHSQRRYYYLTTGKIEEVESKLSIDFLNWEAQELLDLATNFTKDNGSNPIFLCGAILSWDSVNAQGHNLSSGKITLGATKNHLYRNQGYATQAPVKSDYTVDIHQLKMVSNYNSTVYIETIKLLSENHRSRQTEAYKNDQLVLVGQYLETRF